MNLPKAIELNKESERSLREHKFIDHADAVQVGIEALKREQILRREVPYDRNGLLPGETAD